MKHTLLFACALIVTIAPGCSDAVDAGPSSHAGADRPNLLVVTIDTVRADRVGAYGYEPADTPTLDALAERGVLFEQAYTPAPMTLPAHSTLMTGLLPPQHGARVNGVHKLDDDVTTLAERLSAKGYRTGAFVAAFVLNERFGLSQGFDVYDDDLEGAYEQDVENGLARYRPGNLVVDRAIEWLDSADDAPFFAWVHLYDAHYPWFAHDPKAEEPATGTYDGEIAFVDAQIGRLMSYLKDEGLTDATLVATVADHGEGLGDHHEIEHAYLLNDEVLHVPWIMAGPGIASGYRVRTLVSLEDFQPTIGELLDVASAEAWGRSLVAALQGREVEPGESYAETDLPWTSFRWAPQRSLTTSEWKYVRTPETELYDRANDRGELANMAVARRDLVKELEGRLSNMEAEMGKRASAVTSLSSQELEHLAALGYVASDTTKAPDDVSTLADMKTRLAVKDLNAQLRQRLAAEEITPEEHLAIARQLVEASPETPSFHSDLGTILVELGDYASALPAFEKAVDLAPQDPGLHYAYADALQQIGRTADARPHVEMALEMEPKMAAAHVCMGNILRSEGRADLAAGSYLEAIRLRGEYPEAHYNMALTFSDRGMPDKALEHYRKALEEKPGWGLAHRAIANLLLAGGHFDESLEHFEAALEELADDAALRNDMGVALQSLGRPEEALEQYVAAMELAPAFFRPHLNRANMAFDYGNLEVALSEYEAALRLAPSEVEPTARLARFLATAPVAEMRDPERAIALAERAVDLTGGTSSRALEVLAAAYSAAERFPMALSAANRAQQLARSAGDAAHVQELDGHIARYALGEPLVALEPAEPAVPADDDASSEPVPATSEGQDASASD